MSRYDRATYHLDEEEHEEFRREYKQIREEIRNGGISEAEAMFLTFVDEPLENTTVLEHDQGVSGKAIKSYISKQYEDKYGKRRSENIARDAERSLTHEGLISGYDGTDYYNLTEDGEKALEELDQIF